MSTQALVQDLKKQGFSIKEIAKKLGISENTVTMYCYLSREKLSGYQRKRREKAKIEKLRKIAITQLKRFSLPNEWADLALELLRKGMDPSLGMRGSNPEVAIKSVLALICRKYKIPTPKKLIKETRKYPSGRTTSARKYSYQSFLEKLNGVKPAEPMDYINKFFSEQPEFKEALPKALSIAESLPSSFKQGRNPRVLASACIYLSAIGLLLQREISDYFGITEVSLRYTSRQIKALRK